MIDDRIQRSVQSIVGIWITDIDGDIPLKFEDSLAYGLFCQDIASICKRYYIVGKKEQKRKHKQRSIKKYHKLCEDESD